MNEVFNIDKILSLCSYICYALGLNLLFLLSNIPMVLYLSGIGIGQIDTYLFLFALCLIPAGPSLCAIFYSMYKLIRLKDIRVFYDYKKGYLNNFKQGIVLGAAEAIIFVMLKVNLKAFVQVMPSYFFTAVFSVMLLLLVLLTPNLYMIAMRFQMRFTDVIKAAVTITIGKPLLSLGNLSALLLMLAFYEMIPGTAVLFMISIYSVLVLFMNRNLLNTLEKTQTEKE